jgi:hypothetical protein
VKIPGDPAENNNQTDPHAKKLIFQPSVRAQWYARLASPPILITLLILAFGAGLLAAHLLPWSLVHYPAPADSHALSPLNPLTPTPLQPSPTPLPTPTATAPDAGDTLETLYIEIAPADMAQIKVKREEALRLGILLATGGDYVPATVRVGRGGDEAPVELRLKGDWTDHFAHEKWSFRVRTLGENYVFGMRVFSLQDPSTRAFLNEWAFLQNLRLEDVLIVRYRFVHVVLNGEYKGIYAVEEGFSKELFEAQERREGLIIRYDEDLVWEYRAFYDDQLIPRGVNEFYIIDEFQSGRINADPTLSAQRDIAVGLLRALWTGERDGAAVFDMETMGRFLALSDLWRAHHALIWHNLRYYYNPVTARLEPVAFDCQPLASTSPTEGIGLPQDAFYYDPHLQAAYVRELERIAQPGYIEQLEAQIGPEFDALYAALTPEFGSEVLAPPWDVLRARQELIRQMLNPYQTVYAYAQRGEWQMTVDVGNLLDLPVEIIGIEVDGAMLPARSEWVVPESSDLVAPSSGALVLRPLDPQATYMPYVHLRTPYPAIVPTDTLNIPEINIVTRLWGLTTTHTQTVLPGYSSPLAQGPLPTLPTVEEALAQHPYLQPVAGQDTLHIASGTWDVNGNLVLPAGFGLRLDPGVTLRFGRDNYLLASGPLDFQGTDDAPILLQPIADRWSGVTVLEAGAPSAWNYVTVESAAAADQDGWTLTGGVTFYESPIRLEHCRILDSQAEDGINVIRAEFAFIRSEFGPAISDAFDADFSWGTVEECVFHDTGGDGIDVSGSDVQVRGVRLLDIGDKGISVGEGSQLTAQDVYLENVTLGMASKDLSQATLTDATIIGARVAGLAAYIKKPQYGPATLTASHVTFVDIPPEQYALVQTGSWIDLDGIRIWGTDVDVEALYQK